METICKGPCFSWLTVEHCIEFYSVGVAVVVNDGDQLTLLEEEKK